MLLVCNYHLNTRLSVHKLLADILGLLLLTIALGAQEVWEKQEFDDDKKDKQLNGNNEPQGLTNGHLTKTVIIQVKDLRPEALLILLVFIHRPKG